MQGEMPTQYGPLDSHLHIVWPELSQECTLKFLLLHLLFKLLHLSHPFRKCFCFLLRYMILKLFEVNEKQEIIYSEKKRERMVSYVKK